MKTLNTGRIPGRKRPASLRINLLMAIGTLVLMVGCATINTKVPKTGHYTVQNAHSHNDYEQSQYFTAAYNAGFGSMEADIYLVDGELLVAHNIKELDPKRTLVAMYLDPITGHVKENDGYPYANHQNQLELLIDLKDPKDSPAYQKAVALINSFKSLKESKHVLFTFTGNIPSDSIMAQAPAPIYFDGVPGRVYSMAALKKVYMLSDDFANYSNWNGVGKMPEDAYQKMLAVVKAAHKIGKKIRFWNAPDTPDCWLIMEQMGVDYINTDKIRELSEKLK